ncbi:MAG: DUF4194 domain-containing protein [Bacillota bacterium]|nr:DUF4194 domain-containing protein [Bacillota bacterium]MDW7682651.1 DUF4194 domain-containing protein [Bacillota bacterium]
MNWYESYEEMTDKDREVFQETVNLLLRKTFLVYEREEDRAAYRFVEKHLSVIQGYLNLARWDLYHHKRLSLFQLYNREEKNRRNFSLQETIFLFILRLLYDEKQRQLRITQNVLVTGQEIQEKYLALKIRNRLPSREDMQRVLKLFSRYSLLDLKKGVWNEPDGVFVLYPSILAVLESEALEKLAEWLLDDSAFIGLEEGGDDDESFDADEAD